MQSVGDLNTYVSFRGKCITLCVVNNIIKARLTRRNFVRPKCMLYYVNDIEMLTTRFGQQHSITFCTHCPSMIAGVNMAG